MSRPQEMGEGRGGQAGHVGSMDTGGQTLVDSSCGSSRVVFRGVLVTPTSPSPEKIHNLGF